MRNMATRWDLSTSSFCLGVSLILLSTFSPALFQIQINLDCQPGWQLIRHGCYKVYPNLMPWTTAERVCKSYGGHLATPSDYRVNEELGAFVNARGVTNFWIGADRIGVPTNDRRVLQYDNGQEVGLWVGRWAVDQPSFNTGDCTFIHSSASSLWGGQPAAGKQRWELTSCETKLAFLCQRPVCSQGSFHCSNGRCISPILRCDGDDDCRDRSDELECSDNCSQKVRLQQDGGQSEGTYVFPPLNGVQTAGNVDCLLLLETDVGSNIEVAVNNLDLAIEREELVIMDGGQTPDTSRVVTRLTGRLTRQQFFYSSNNMMILNTRSTRAGTPGGFEVTYKSVKVDVDPTNKLVATDQYQELRSPLSDDYELGSQDLTYIIEAENPRKTITVEIISQDLAPDSVVLFRDGDTVHDGLLATLRGSYSGNGFVLSSGRRLYLNKQTILGGQHSGIAVRYMQGCKVSMNQTTGYISSAGFPTNSYPNAVECEWHVRHPDGEALTLSFDSMNISPDDILKIYDGNNALLKSYTRSAIQQPLRIPNGVFSAIFTATSSTNEKGFNLTFSKDCPEPDLDLTMSIITPIAQNSYGSSFIVRCKQGSTFLQQEHQNKDQVLMICGAWGRWNVNTSPKCMRVLCPKAPGLENGYVISSIGDLAYEGSITYECYQGFSITGPNTITCQANGSWTQMPTCETSRCSQLPSGPDNGSSDIDGDGTSYGTIVRFSCNDGYDLIGNTTMLCSSRGQWVGKIPMCKILTCYTPDILNARVSSNTADVFESVTVNCDPGYRTSIMGITAMTCSESRIFVPALKCENIDECAENRPCNKTCIDLPGSYHCECDQGYVVEGDDCRDIDECYPENNCSGTCENFPGGYQCACSEGYSLFDKNGAEDHFLPPGEDGARLGDVYLINKTCVPKLCSTPAIPLNAIQLTKAPGFYFNDSIDYKCKLGYQLSDQAAGRLTCGADRGWHGIQINCEVIMCDVEPIPLGLENPGMLTPSNVTRVAFGESINITCIVPGFRPVSMFTRTRRCTLINGQYKLDGSVLDYECGVIDCGPPLSLAGSRYINVTGTQFGDTAIFDCEAQYVLSGASALTGDTTISCQANSQWDLGSLDCSGKRCSDPGQIQFGVQKISNYRSQVVFECAKQGYELMPMGPLACDLSINGTVSYNASLPQCVDVIPPVMQSPCTSGTYILELQKFESIGKNFPSITAIDNESGIKELVVEPAWPSKEEYITSAAQVLTFTYTFFDHAGNTAECRVIVKGIDTTPPTITCPTSMELTFRDSPVTVEFNRSIVQVQDDFSDASKVSVSFTPSIFTLQPSDFQRTTSFPKTHSTAIKANATDEAGNQATCEFDLFFKPDVCSRYHVRQHNNTSLVCAEDNTGGLICRATCLQGYRLYENLNTSSVIFSCPGPGQPFTRDTDVTCVNVESGDLEGTYHLLFDGIYNSISVNNSCYDNYLSIIEDTLASLGEKITSTMCREGANTRISGQGKLDSLIVDEMNNQVKVRMEVLLERRPKTDYTTCAEGTILYLESALQFDIGEKLSTFRPSQCSSLELEGNGLTFIARGYICDQPNIEATIYIDADGRDVGICRQCPEGTYRAMDGTCVKCPHGAYSMSKDVSTCRDCPGSTGTYKEGAFDSRECLAECGSGTYNAASGLPPCSACPINTYRENSTTCLPCPANTTTKAAGANSSSECTEPCQPGYFNEHDGHAPCSKCLQHTYATEIGRRRCSSCSAGQYTETTGAVSPEDCLYLSNSTECRSRCVNGLCVNNQHSQSCKCDTGWTGENCDEAFEPCDSSPCHNGGTCTSSGIQYNCSCPNGTSGDQCEVITLSCNDQSCLNNGMCENLVGGPKCHCLPGFSGIRCERSEDLCSSQPCQNGGQCVAHGNVRFTCSCIDGYVGPTCAEKADLCYSNPCRNNAVCSTVDTQSYVCDCGPGYDGTWCERRLQMCNTVALCGPGSWCVEYEERDTYICVCPPEAEYSNPTGPRNQTCTQTDFCLSNPCYHGGTCRNGATGYTCNCLPGYDGSRCQHDKDDCVSSPCKNGGLCEDHLLGYTCSCIGYTGNNCEVEIDECIFSNCTNPGSLRCQDKLNGYECVCNSGYSGDDCEINVDDCASAPCLHNGMCVDQIDDYKCECLPGWSGRNCEQEISFCSDNPCENGAECKNLFNDYLCRCQLSTFGVNCTESVKICDVANPCVWGSCADVSGNASCSCPIDYTGERCQEKINPCFSDTGVCQNEGACVSSLDSYECRCQPGYVGPVCSINPSNCDAAQCPPTATCIDLLNTAACRCPLGKEGPMCADDTNSNFDLLFRHSYKTSLASLEYPIPLSSSAFSVSTWVQFTDLKGKGVMLSLFAVPSPNSLNGKTPLLWISESALHYYDPMTREEFQLPQPVDAINDGKWHYLVVNVNGGKGQLNYIADAVSSNTMTIPMRSFHLNVWIVLGCHYDPESEEPVPGEGFQGKLSRFTLYNRTLDFREEVTQVGNKNVFALFSDSVLRWGLEFVLKSGVQRLVPSGADKTCPTGFTGDYPSCLERVSGKAMVSISSGQCPDNILRYNPGRLTEVTYEVPTFSGQANVRTSLSTEDVYVWGQYPVVVEASNSDGNTALCLFDIYVQNDQCTNPPKPPKAKDLLCLPQSRGEYQMEGYQQCGITCEDGYSPSIPGPHLHTCGPSGNWDPENQFVPYRLSSCGSVNKTKQNLVIEIRYRVPNRECQAVRFALTREIRRTQNDLNRVWNQVCSQNDCSDTLISVECLNARRKRQTNTGSTLLELKADITLPDISETVTSRQNTQETVSMESLYDGLLLSAMNNPFNYSEFVSDASPYDHTIIIENLCEVPQVLINGKCVSCGPGTFYNNQTNSCHFCPAGSYQPLEGQISCILCDSSSTTQYYGSHEASDCKEKCNPGHYFDIGTNKCKNCSRGFYQPDSGQFYCLACEADKTTKYPGTVLESSCANDCPPGQEIGPNNDCVVCTIGFFRGTDDALCQRCPAGNVTLFNESKSVVDCNVADNPPGTYRNTTNPSRYHPCPVDQYQPQQWQFECQPCGPGYRAESVGSTAESDCKFFCPAGQQVKNGEDSCEFCPFGTYRDGAKIFESCDNCPDAYTTPASGAKSRDDCSLYRCPAGSQPNSAQTGCDLCPQGQFQASANQASCDVCRAGFSTRQEGTIDSNACETYCPPGKEKKEGLCIDCQIGYFKNNNVDLFSNCTICTNNKYVTASIGATSNDNCTVLNCQEGFKANIATLQCEPCPKGSYQDQKYQMSCIPCKGNNFTRYANSTSESDCESYCPPGFEKIGGQCQACKRGFYKNNDLDLFMACTKCDNGFVTPEGSPATYSTNCTVPDCQPGTYISQGGCVECPSGTWQNVSWSESCNPCPEDKDTAPGADSIDLCLLNCPEGKQNPAGTDVCESCPVGYYKDSPGTTSCVPCANLSQNNIRISAEPGADNLAKCNKLVCLPGFYPNGPICSPCPYGSYQPEQWQDSCIPCPNGKTTYTLGATNNTECETSCPIGEGLYNGQCRICGVDEYNDESDPTRRTCASCPPGFITSRVGATLSAECNITDCPNPGTYRNSLTNSCANCPLGQYQNIPRQDACQLCQEGYTTKDVRSTSSDDCKRDCLPGQQLNEATGQCEPCPKGSYRSKALGQDSWTCQDCGNEMTTSGPGAVQVDDCNIATCSAGFGYDRTLARCLECPANTYQDLDGQFLPCKSCPTNQITVRNATVSRLECSFPCSLGSTLCSITSQICVDDSSATGGYRCDCKDAYSRVQNTCTHKCNIPNYCGEKGVCQRSPFMCLCTEGYTGERCSIRPAASTQSSDKVETLVIAVVTTVCGLLFLLLLIVCICVVAKRRATPPSTSVTPDYDERGSMASHSVKGYDDYPTFAVNPAFSSKPPSVFGTTMGQGMNGQGTKIYSNDIYTDEDSDPAVYKA